MVEENEHGARLVPAEAPGARRDEGDGELAPTGFLSVLTSTNAAAEPQPCITILASGQ